MQHDLHPGGWIATVAIALLLSPTPRAQTCGPGSVLESAGPFSNGYGTSSLPFQDVPSPIERFDPALGTLVRVDVTARCVSPIDILAENVSQQAGCTLDYTIDETYVVRFPASSAPDLVLTPTVSGSRDLDVYDGSSDYDGPSGFTQGHHVFEQAMGSVTDPGVLQSVFTGPGTVDFLLSGSAVASHQGCGNPLFFPSYYARMDLTVRYWYCAQVPCVDRHRRNCGSLLLYPEFDNRQGILTLMSITNACCDYPNPGVSVEFRFMNKDNCLKTDQTFALTPCDTVSFITTSVNSGGPNKRGYAFAYTKVATITPNNPSGTPVVRNQLIGQELILNGITSVNYSMNAVSFKGLGDEGDLNDDDGDGVRDLNGPGSNLPEYEEAPDEILIPRFLAQDGPIQPVYNSEIIVINLSGGSAFTTIVDITGYNDNEDPQSAQYQFYCWDKPKLRDFAPFTLQSHLLTTLHDPDEIIGAPQRESGWFFVDGLVANSSGPEAINDPAVYAVLIEIAGGESAADLPFERCSQVNGDLLPNNIFGDGGPGPAVPGDDQ